MSKYDPGPYNPDPSDPLEQIRGPGGELLGMVTTKKDDTGTRLVFNRWGARVGSIHDSSGGMAQTRDCSGNLIAWGEHVSLLLNNQHPQGRPH